MVRLNMISLTFGYQFSESLIREVAAALSPLADERRLVFRISFERFAFYCRGYREGELSSFCGEINHALSRIKPLQFIGCGIGILEVDSEIRDAESILRNASIAAERSVGSALFGCRIFDDTMKEQILREIQIKDELMGLHPAGVNGCLYLQYQPILNLRTTVKVPLYHLFKIPAIIELGYGITLADMQKLLFMLFLLRNVNDQAF